VLIPLLLALLAWLPGLNWGLPTRGDALFGSRSPWTGAELLALLPPDDPAAPRGADVDSTPLPAADGRAVVLNATDADRAVIVRRYRLQSKQPDEFINFKAIADMARRGDLDPRLYQYGGLWLYPLAGTLKAASWVGLVELRSEPTFYLDHPEAFGRFYVVARLMSVAWGLVGVVAAVWLAGRITRDAFLATIAGVIVATLPIVVNAAHEAKPHLAGASLALLATALATRYVEVGSRRRALLAGAAAGASFAMVVNGVLALVLLPAMVLLRPAAWRQRLVHVAVASFAAAGVYVLTNPFVLYNAITRPELLQSNLGNSTAMYAIGVAGVGRAIELLARGGTMPLLVIAVIGGIALLLRPRGRTAGASPSRPRREPAALLLATLGGVVLLQFVLLADGKPVEYARFAIVPLAGLAIVAVAAMPVMLGHVQIARRLAALLAGIVAFGGLVQTLEFTMPVGSRGTSDVSRLAPPDAPPATVALAWEPAPWSSPPIDLFRHTLVLLPDRRVPADLRTVGVDALVAPGNLASQLALRGPFETFNWAANRWVVHWAADPSPAAAAPAASNAR
jgi:hypothetical protein